MIAYYLILLVIAFHLCVFLFFVRKSKPKGGRIDNLDLMVAYKRDLERIVSEREARKCA